MSDEPMTEEGLPVVAMPVWSPSHWLHGRLLLGTWAALAVGVLLTISAAVELAIGQAPGFQLSHALAWMAVVPLVVVLRTYQDLGRETDSTGLAKGCLCLFWAFVFFQVLEFLSLKLLRPGWQIALLSAVGIGLLGLLGYIGASAKTQTSAPPAEDKDAAPEEGKAVPEAEAGPVVPARVGLLGGLLIGLVALLKVFAKGHFFAKLVAFRAVGRLFRRFNWDSALTLAGIVLFCCAAGFLIWFGVSKIRLRGRLGRLAVVLGGLEILLPVLFAGLFLNALTTVATAMERPGIRPEEVQEIQAQALAGLTVTTLMVDIVYAALTALLFLAIRSRFRPDWEWELAEEKASVNS